MAPNGILSNRSAVFEKDKARYPQNRVESSLRFDHCSLPALESDRKKAWDLRPHARLQKQSISNFGGNRHLPRGPVRRASRRQSGLPSAWLR
jgi:hypothetical protein